MNITTRQVISVLKGIILPIVVAVLLMNSGCGKTKSSTNSTDDCVRIGAVCKDGTSSDATGSGACSSHGGVDHWICR